MESKEYKELKKDIAKIEKDISALQKCTSGMSDNVDKIHNALVGDSKFGQDGLVKMVKRHELWMERQKYMYAKIYGGMVVISTLSGLLIKFWDTLF
jgi:hypothetical protein